MKGTEDNEAPALLEGEKQKKAKKVLGSLPDFVKLPCGGIELEVGIPSKGYSTRCDMYILFEAQQLSSFFKYVLEDFDQLAKRSYKKGLKRTRNDGDTTEKQHEQDERSE